MRDFRICRIFGIDIEMQLSWLVMFGLVVWIVGGLYLPSAVPNQSQLGYWFFGTITALFFSFSVLFHELSHSLVAKIFKIYVERITLFLLGGVAQTKEQFKTAKSEFLIALAGPASSMILAGIFWLAKVFLPDISKIFSESLSYLIYINVALAIFNLIPVFPMDGGRISRSAVWQMTKDFVKATKIARYTTIALMIPLLVAVFFWGGIFTALLVAYISWMFILPEAKTEYKMAVLSKMKVKEVIAIHDFSSEAVLSPNYGSVCGPDDNLAEVYLKLADSNESELLVVKDGKIVGRISRDIILSIIVKIK